MFKNIVNYLNKKIFRNLPQNYEPFSNELLLICIRCICIANLIKENIAKQPNLSAFKYY